MTIQPMNIESSGYLQTDNENEILTAEEVAKILRISSSKVRNMVQRGELKGMHLGRRILIHRQDLEQFIQQLRSI